jgi:hypothetical protein
MRSMSRSLLLLGFLVLPAFADAQTTLAGVVRDPSGSVLPGVTVEASSSALIEKVRTVAPKAYLKEPVMVPAAAAALMTLRRATNGNGR